MNRDWPTKCFEGYRCVVASEPSLVAYIRLFKVPLSYGMG